MVALAFTVAAVCGYQFPAPGITDGQVASLGLTQGFAGRAAILTGDCLPGCGLNRIASCSWHKLDGRVLVAVPADAPLAIGAEVSCGGAGGHRVQAGSTDLGNYAITLDNGTLGVLNAGLVGLNGVSIVPSGGFVDSFDSSLGS